jgi:HSP20 family protein
MTLVKFHQTPVRTLMHELWNNGLNDWTGGSVGPATQPAVNITQHEKGFRLELAVPGYAKEAIALSVEKNVLKVRGEKAPAETAAEAKFLRREFGYSTFERAFRLPETIDTDNVKASFSNGILSIELALKPDNTPIARTIVVE